MARALSNEAMASSKFFSFKRASPFSLNALVLFGFMARALSNKAMASSKFFNLARELHLCHSKHQYYLDLWLELCQMKQSHHRSYSIYQETTPLPFKASVLFGFMARDFVK